MSRRRFGRLGWPALGVGLVTVLTAVLAQHPAGATVTAATSVTGNSVTAAQPALVIASPDPAQAPAGTTVTLSGTASTDASGTFTGSAFTVPAVGAGTYDVVVTTGAWATPPVSFVIPTYAATVMATAGLVNYWWLGTGTTTTAVPDSWSTGNGTAAGGFGPGGAGAVAGDTAATLWFKAPAGDAGHHQLVSKAQACGLEIYNHQLGFGDDVAGPWNNTGIVVDDNQWHHVVMTYQSGVVNGTRIYLDGALVLTATLSAPTQTYPLVLGSRRSTGGSYSEYFKGTLDEVAAYNTVLTSATVLAHYRAR